ncbi:MAG: hypothetical protein QNK27_14210 [Desulfuromusa sp.]|nr:hypothetical protein [Desulfuromusa sp.]
MAAIAMTVNAFKTRALFDGKIKTAEQDSSSNAKEAPEVEPGKT